MSNVMKLTQKQQDNLPDWAIYGADNQGGVVVVDGDKAYAEILKALGLTTNQDSAEVARKWVQEILCRRLFKYGLANVDGNPVASGLDYNQMASMRAEIPGTSKVLEGFLRVRFVGEKYKLAGLKKTRTTLAKKWRSFTPKLLAAGLV